MDVTKTAVIGVRVLPDIKAELMAAAEAERRIHRHDGLSDGTAGLSSSAPSLKDNTKTRNR